MKRRDLVALSVAALAAPSVLFAQSKRVYRIAILDDSVESARADSWKIFRDRLRKLVVADGNDLAYETRYARGAVERLPALAAELVALKPDVIVCPSTPPTIAAMKATRSIPIVFTAAGDPVGTGLVASLARPGGNVTGTTNVTTEIGIKQLELMREIAPGAVRLAYLTDGANKASLAAFRRLEERARSLKVEVLLLDCRERTALEKSLATARQARTQGLIVGSTGVLLEHRDAIVGFAAEEKLPAVYARREYVDAGGLLSYGASLELAVVRAASYVHRILKGASPASLPVEQIAEFRMVINWKTARTLGIRVPDSIRARADEAIE